ncbi:MAG: GNAT family N-acetyltransferase [Spirochaetia bacterium]|nr:GNAT family N-acetyltransferase [Spirochaetia bacterium]
MKKKIKPENDFLYMQAALKDGNEILELLTPYINQKILIPRSIEQIEKGIKNTWIAKSRENKIVATASIIFFSNNLCEIRALVVDKKYQSKNVGKNLITQIISFLTENYPTPLQIFALTYAVEFFKKIGFTVVSKSKFPDKIYEDCKFCLKQETCDETAVEMLIKKKDESVRRK